MKKAVTIKQNKWIRLVGIILAFISVFLINEVQAQVDLEKVDSLAKSSITIRTIEPTDEDFSDLMPLIDKIGEAKVVVLGESTHSEGATTQAKSRMIRFLHQKMGFDVLAWEAGLIDCWRMNEALRNQEIPLRNASQYMMQGGWDSSAYTQPLFEYIRNSWKTSRPLEMAGFDIQRPPRGGINNQELLTELFRRSTSLKFSNKELELVNQFFSKRMGLIGVDNTKMDDKDREQARNSLNKLLNQIKTEHTALSKTFSEREIILAERAIYVALRDEQFRYDFERFLATKDESFTRKSGSERDATMGENFIWLAQKIFPDRKIIIWAATAHLTRNTQKIESMEKNLSYQGVSHMGDFVFKELGQKVYTIAFTAYSGEIGATFSVGPPRTEPLKEPPPESFEAFAHGVGKPYLFVDLRRLNKDHWLRQPMIALPLGFNRNKADWSQIIDAFFFIDRMTPDARLPKMK